MAAVVQDPFVARMGLRLLGRPAVDPRDVGARLDRALATASRGADGAAPRRAAPVQVVVDAHGDQAGYTAWRRDELLSARGAMLPELVDDQWACVLWAMAPAELPGFLEGGRAGLLGAPLVGRFRSDVRAEVGLAATLTAWLQNRRAVVLAPPLSRADAGLCVSMLKRGWPLAPADLSALGDAGSDKSAA